MDDKIKKIEDILMKDGKISFSKQCKKEYIIYTFVTDEKREMVKIQIKEHFENKGYKNPSKRKTKEIDNSISFFSRFIVKKLIERGYEIELNYDL